MGLDFAFLLRGALLNSRVLGPFRIIISTQLPDQSLNVGTNCTVRFHRMRLGQEWLKDDLDSYKEEALAVLDFDLQPLSEVLERMQRWRIAAGTFLILMPLILLLSLPLLRIFLGALGLDIHWISNVSFYCTIVCAILILCVCVVAGVHLRRSAKRLS
jgi:hypothetical protein